ncbi:MAG: hypothetical protein NVS9B3_01660 [Gemmatimonadaceae bacterium]
MTGPRKDAAVPPPTRGILPGIGSPSGDDGYPRAWFWLMDLDWRTLAIVPGDPTMSALASATALAAAAKHYSDVTIEVVTAEGADPTSARAIVAALGRPRTVGDRVLVALSSPLADAGVIQIGRAADACLLLVGLGNTTLGAARDTMESIGRERFVGSITVSRDGR